ncbi:MAG: hypothetical protein CUN57_03015, partial [Phototrophicales bacterium]
LNKKPGQKASLTRFVSYVNTEWDIELNISLSRRKKLRAGSLAAERKLVRLLKAAGENASYDDEKILAAAMEFYHGVSSRTLKTMGYTLRKDHELGGVIATIQSRDYGLPQIVSVPSHHHLTRRG